MNRSSIFRALALPAFLAACTRPSHTPAPMRVPASSVDADLAAFAAELDSLRTARRIPGLSVAVVRDGRVVLARGFGWADVESRVAATENTPYNAASVAKTVSGIVAMRLVERGVLDLDRPMTAYEGWAEFCADTREGGPPVFFADYHCDTQPFTLRHVLSMTANGNVGERFYYNPVSFSWASRPMAQVAGKGFSDLVAGEVFAPAGMARSARKHRNLPLRADLAAELAKPYHVDSAGALVRSEDPPPQGDGAAGGVVTTVLDLAKMDLALDEGKLLGDAAKAEMWRAGRAPSGAALPYGIGWYVQEVDGRRAVWHSGWWPQAYSALYLKLPDERLTLILLANSEGMWWGNPLDAAQVETSPFAAAFLRRFRGPTTRR